jgi:HEAT repeat protein
MTKAEFNGFVHQLKSDNPNDVAQAAKGIQEKSTPSDIPGLLELLSSDDFVLREAAAWPLSDNGTLTAFNVRSAPLK